jgi:energy-coupling factor transporter ATP-binding protein EcfA2
MWSIGSEGLVFSGFGKHNLIIGKNNVGKSKLLAAINFFGQKSRNIISSQPFDVPAEVLYDSGSDQIAQDAALVIVVDVGDEVQLAVRSKLVNQLKSPRMTAMINDITSRRLEIHAKITDERKMIGGVALLDVRPPNDDAYSRIKASTPGQMAGDWNSAEGHVRSGFLTAFCSQIDYVSGWRSLREQRLSDPGNLNIIQQLHLWSDPPQFQKHLRRRFERIQQLFHDLTRSKIDLHPEHTGQNLHVKIGDRYLPIESLGDGIQHLLMIAYHLVADSESILLLEEPETHLHPEIQRHLMAVLRRELRGQSFTTTHSPVLLDAGLHSHVYRVEHDGHRSAVNRCETPHDLRGVLDLLDVRASDILQANLVIWVEGPTDRSFLRKCFELRGDKLEEGVDYQIAFYGGRLRSHLTFDEMAPDLVNLDHRG